MIYELYYHQKIDVDKIRKAYRMGAQSVLFVAPCGYGKTVIFSYISEGALSKHRKILILSHRKNLIRQISKELNENEVKHGIIASGYPSIRYSLQVASIDSLVGRLNMWEYFDLIIGDEIHHIAANTWQTIKRHFISENKNTKFFGCTATPLRLDNYGMGNDFDIMVVGHDYQYLINTTNPKTGMKFLSKPVYHIPSHINLDDVKKSSNGDFNKRQLSKKIKADRYIIGDAIEIYANKFEYMPALTYCINIDEAIKNEKLWIKAGYKARAIHSKMDYRDVLQGIEDLRTGKIHNLISCDMIGEGTNVKRAQVLFEQRPTMSLTISHQHNGRILRPWPGKVCSYHIDQVGNCERHGLIHWPIKWELTKERFEPVIPSIKYCDYCFYPYPSTMKKCPECGREKIIKSRSSEIERRDGNLKKIEYRQPEFYCQKSLDFI